MIGASGDGHDQEGAGFALIISLFAGASLAGPPVPAFTTPTRVTIIKTADEGIPQEEPLLGSGPQGTLFLSLPHVPALFRSDDRGNSWRTLFDTRTGVGEATAGGSADGAIWDSGNGIVHWLGLRGVQNIPYQRSSDNGVHWSAPVDFTTSTIPDRQWIAADDAGNVVAVWCDSIDPTVSLVAWRASHDTGLTWSDISFFPGRAYAGSPARGVHPGEFFVPLVRYDIGFGSLAVARTRDGGHTWTVVENVVRNLAGIGLNNAYGPLVINFPFLAVDDADNVYVTYSVPNPPVGSVVGSPLAPAAVYLSRSLDGGDTWGSPIRISGALRNGLYGWVVAGAKGRIAIAFYEDVSGTSRIVPSVWHTRLAYSENADTATPTFAIGDADKRAHVGLMCNECREFSRLDHLGIAALPDGQVVVAWDRDGPVNPRNLDVVTARTTNLRLR